MGLCGFEVKDTENDGQIGDPKKKDVCDCPKPPDRCNGGGGPGGGEPTPGESDPPYDCDFFGSFPSHFDTYDSIDTFGTFNILFREPTQDADVIPEYGCAGIGCSDNVNFDLTSNFYGDCLLCLQPPEGMTPCEAAKAEFAQRFISASVACGFNNGYSCASDAGICVDYTGYCPVDPDAEGAYRVVACCQDCVSVGCQTFGNEENPDGSCFATEEDAIDEALMMCPSICDDASESVDGDLDFCSFVVAQDLFQTNICSGDPDNPTVPNSWGFVCCCD